MTTLFFTFVKTAAFVGAIYFSVALAIQINLGGDVEYWLSLFIAAGIVVYSVIEWYQRTLVTK